MAYHFNLDLSGWQISARTFRRQFFRVTTVRFKLGVAGFNSLPSFPALHGFESPRAFRLPMARNDYASRLNAQVCINSRELGERCFVNHPFGAHSLSSIAFNNRNDYCDSPGVSNASKVCDAMDVVDSIVASR